MKKLIITSIFLMIPILIGSVILGIIGFEHWIGKSQEITNAPFISILFTILFTISSFACIFIIVTLMLLSKYADKIDVLDQEIEKAIKAKIKFELATLKFVQNIDVQNIDDK